MSLLLNIDTSLEKAAVSIALNGEIIASEFNEKQQEHASWLHPAIDVLLKSSRSDLQQLSAVGVSIGPGSFTGLRVGLSAAKGFCYALSIPLVTVGTLEVIAHSIKTTDVDLICPLIDARRMEVYTAVYDKYFVEKIPPFAAVLDKEFLGGLLVSNHILFCGNGSKKLHSVLTHPNARFNETGNLIHSLSELTYQNYTGNKFAVLAYTEPIYIKDFYSPAQKDISQV